MKKGPVYGTIIAMVVVTSALIFIDWSQVLNAVSQEIEEKKPFEKVQQNLEKSKELLEPFLSEPYKAADPVARNDLEIENNSSEINVSSLEQKVHAWTNYYRERNGLSTLTFNSKIASIARDHSNDMAQNNYFSHNDLYGRNLSYRYEKAGFECAIQQGNYIYQGAENLWRGWTFKYTINGMPSGYYEDDELAKLIVDSWMNSPGHRKNILTDYWISEGIGIAITKDGKVYATQNFC